ncbi:MAG: glycosyltransferase family 2 protein [Bacteroidetes bacterium]|nr:glycosyltransferase family 2 protein [Bacteroidota bacterium]
MDKTVTPLVKVTVVMPAYDAEKYIKQAIESILNQTFKDFVFLIINDGSTDQTEKIILSYADKRINYVKNEKNIGLIATLNYAISITDTEYMVRMDADDISLPDRIDRQIDFMQRNESVWVCGSQVEYFGQSQKISAFPETHDSIKAQLLFENCIAHPSVIMRLNHIKKYQLFYSPDFINIEDYDLWLRIAMIGQLANINTPLLKYRLEGQNITIRNWQTREKRLKLVYQNLLQELGVDVTEENLKLHIELSGNSETICGIKKLRLYTESLIANNKAKKIYSAYSLSLILQQLWKQLFFKVAHNGFFETITYWRYTKTFSFVQLRYLIGIYKMSLKAK